MGAKLDRTSKGGGESTPDPPEYGLSGAGEAGVARADESPTLKRAVVRGSKRRGAVDAMRGRRCWYPEYDGEVVELAESCGYESCVEVVLCEEVDATGSSSI